MKDIKSSKKHGVAIGGGGMSEISKLIMRGKFSVNQSITLCHVGNPSSISLWKKWHWLFPEINHVYKLSSWESYSLDSWLSGFLGLLYFYCSSNIQEKNSCWFFPPSLVTFFFTLDRSIMTQRWGSKGAMSSLPIRVPWFLSDFGVGLI